MDPAAGEMPPSAPLHALFVVDEENKIVSTPAYMLGPTIKHVYEGIRKTVEAVLALA